MVYHVEDIVRDVRICIDQNTDSGQLLQSADPDTLALDEIIRSKIIEAVTTVHKTAPVHMLEDGHTFGDAVYWGDLESGWVLLPDDFMRLIVFEMSDWERAVTAAVSASDPLYKLQRSRIKALRGTAQKPVCAIVNRPEGKALEFYSCKNTNAYVSKAQYLPYPSIDKMGGIDICERCKTAVVYAAASSVLITLGEAEKANLFSTISNTALQ